MMNLDMSYLKEISSQFRKAIIKYGIKKLPISFHEFPMGSCGDTSLLLGKYFDEFGLGQFDYVCGEINGKTHAWLEKDGIIVDITADQFNGISDEVIVTTTNCYFYKRFKENLRHKYIQSFGNDDFVDMELLPAYYEIISCLDNKYKPVLK
ncbi:hypothetical protein [Clostridium sp. JNZ J1-5]